MIKALNFFEQMHNNFYIHRDIKPENILVGNNNNPHQLFIIDFGLSKKYIVDYSHIKWNLKDQRFIGTPKYASINTHLGY